MDPSLVASPVGGAADLRALAPGWDELAAAAPSPFLTTTWLAAWEDTYGDGRSHGVVVRDHRAAVAGGAWVPHARADVHAEAFEHLLEWDVVARDDHARAAVWRALLEHTPDRLVLPALVRDAPATEIARRELRAAGYRLIERTGHLSPYLELPASAEELMAAVSRNLRSQAGRRRRAFEKEGELRLRTVTDGDDVGPALDAVLRLEAAGWKGREGTAILNQPGTERLYRAFAQDAARAGILRLYLLELDDRLLAADIGLAIGGTGYLLKTSYDEDLGRASPGLLLRAEVLRASIEEGLRAYEFLGGAETYKMQWGPQPRPRVEVTAYRGVRELPVWAWRARVRPLAVRVAKRILRRG